MHYCVSMRSPLKSVLLGLLLLSAGRAWAVPASELRETYQPIIERNPFGLHPPPPPPTNNPTANAKDKAKLEVFLTGITSIGYPKIPKQAYLMTREQNKSTNYYALSEGIEQDGIKILNIDDSGRKVRIHTGEGEMMLSFETHGIAAPAMPKQLLPGQPGAGGPPPGPPGAQPGLPNQPISATPQPIAAPSYQNNNASRQIPSRRVRAGMDNSGISAGGGIGSPLPLPGATQTGVEGQVQPQMDPAEQYVRMHLNNAAAEKAGIPMPPLPIINR